MTLVTKSAIVNQQVEVYLMIYFIQAEKLGLIKIGKTNPSSMNIRLASLRAMCPDKLILLATILDERIISESKLHAKFSHLREHGEWFRPEKDLLNYIKDIPEITLPKQLKHNNPEYIKSEHNKISLVG